MKNLLFILSIFLLSFVLLACESKEEITYETVLNQLTINYAEGDSAMSVTQDIELPTTSILDSNASFTWMSSHPHIISTSGVVNPSEQDTTVYLSLTLKVGNVERIETFTVIVKGSIIFYDVSFVVGDNVTTESVQSGTTIGIPEVEPSLEGHQFMGWFVDEEPYDFSNLVTKDLMIYAQFEEYLPQVYVINTYTQNLTNSSYTRESVEQKIGQVGENISLNPIKEGYTINSELSILQATLQTGEMTTLKVYFDRNIYDVNYYIEDEIDHVESYPHEYLMTLSSGIERYGYTFIGWYLDQDFLTEAQEQIIIDQDLNLYAKYEAIPEVSYDIDIYLQDIDTDNYILSSTINASSHLGYEVTYNQEIEGFSIDQTLSISELVLTDSNQQKLEIYYQRNIYELSVYRDETLLSRSDLKYGTLFELSLLNSQIEGYTFEGWYLEPTFETLLTDEIEITSDLQIYGRFIIIPIVAYDVNLYRQNINDDEYVLYQTLTFEDEAGQSVFYVETYEGFHFNYDLSNTSITLEQGVVQSINVYYDRNNYTVFFMDDDSILGDTEYRFGQLITPIADPEKSNYLFIAWTRFENSDIVFDFDITWSGNLILYPIWEYDGVDSYTGYYESLSGVSDGELETVLFQLISDMTKITYDMAKTVLPKSDVDPLNSSRIILIYDHVSVINTWDPNNIWNREHVFPQSLLGVDTSSSSIHEGSDVHNLRPSNPSTNSSRGNRPFVDGTGSNSISGTGYWPGEYDKGDVARILFYMDVRYQHLSLVNVFPSLYQMAYLNVLLQWHIEDPVDDFERHRNDVIFTYQDNRNPFIDHPELVERIYGPIPSLSIKQQVFSMDYRLIQVQRIDISVLPSNDKNRYLIS